MSYTVTKTTKFTKEGEDLHIVEKDSLGGVLIDHAVYIPPELLQPLAAALLEMAR
jgi:hypothetical protein